MSFTPIRDTRAYALANVTDGAVITTADMNGLSDAMGHLANRGLCSITASGQRVNDKVIPVLGVAYPDVGTFFADRKSIAIPFTLPPGYDRFSLFYFFRLQILIYIASVYGGKLTVSIAKAGVKYELDSVFWAQYAPPFYEGSKFITAEIPRNLTLGTTTTESLYLVIDLDYTAGIDGTPNDNAIGTTITPFPNLSTYWNGLFSLRFAVWKSCDVC